MKNKEKYLDEILEFFIDHTGGKICDWKNKMIFKKEDCYSRNCDKCREKVKEWLEEEYKEPIKLKQFEYDMLETNNMSHNRKFNSFYTYEVMKEKGHFKAVTDTSMTIKQILDNCEVVD